MLSLVAHAFGISICMLWSIHALSIYMLKRANNVSFLCTSFIQRGCPVKRELSLKVICENVKFSNCDFCNSFRDNK